MCSEISWTLDHSINSSITSASPRHTQWIKLKIIEVTVFLLVSSVKHLSTVKKHDKLRFLKWESTVHFRYTATIERIRREIFSEGSILKMPVCWLRLKIWKRYAVALVPGLWVISPFSRNILVCAAEWPSSFYFSLIDTWWICLYFIF